MLAIIPNVGLLAGGNRVTLSGQGFAAPGLNVEFGGRPADCQTQNDWVLRCLVPGGEPGTVSVRVENTGMNVLLPDAYTYINLTASAALPNSGALAGGTFVRLYGDGFGGEMDVRLGEAPAVDLEILDSGRLTLRTPPGSEGPVSLTLIRDGAVVTLPDLFTYFEPYDNQDWTSGGGIDGAINVTVIDDVGRLEGAFVMLGIDPTTRYQGFTNPKGQITFSGPDVIGPFTVTAGKALYSAWSWVQVNAQNLTLKLSKPIDYPSTPPTCGDHPAIIRGTVSRIKDAYNYGNDLVKVTTTYGSTPMPDPGANAELINQGSYELRSRLGDMVVMAQAGFEGENGFVTHALGFYPFLSPIAGSERTCTLDGDCEDGEICYEFGEKTECNVSGTCCVSDETCNVEAGETCTQVVPDRACVKLYDGIDIVIDTPLSQEMEVILDDPPLSADPTLYGTLPDSTGAFIWYDFNSMGVYYIADVSAYGVPSVTAKMPKALPGGLFGSPFHIQTGAYVGWGQPESEVFLTGLVDTTQPVHAYPMLGTVQPLSPAQNGTLVTPLDFVFSVNKEPLPSAYIHRLYRQASSGSVLAWTIYTAGMVTSYSLPTFPEVAADARLLPGSYTWQMLGYYAPQAVYNKLNLRTLGNWRSRSVSSAAFTIPE